MDDPTSLLFGLDSFVVVDVARVHDGVRVVIETTAVEAPCRDCGTLSRPVKERPLVQLKDLPTGGQPVVLWWRTRRLVGAEPTCPLSSFTEVTAEIAPRSRLTGRLRARLAASIAGSNRAVSDVAREYRVAWQTAHATLVAAAARWLPEPEPPAVRSAVPSRWW